MNFIKEHILTKSFAGFTACFIVVNGIMTLFANHLLINLPDCIPAITNLCALYAEIKASAFRWCLALYIGAMLAAWSAYFALGIGLFLRTSIRKVIEVTG